MTKRIQSERQARRGFLRLVGVAGLTAGLVPFPGTASAAELNNSTALAAVSRVAGNQAKSAKTSQTAATLRDLWIGHIFWVRNVSIAIFNRNDAAMKAAEGQAVSNAQSIAATIEPFYGTGAKEMFFKLLAGHYGAVKAYLLATASDDGFRSSERDAGPHVKCGADCDLSKQSKSIPSEGCTA
jgi:hypothetical protein